MRVRGAQVEPVNLLQLCDSLERALRKGLLALEDMQHDSFKQIAQRNIELFRQPFQNLQQPLFDADPVCTRSIVFMALPLPK